MSLTFSASPTSGILLAGGRGVRFRGDKSMARLAGIPLLVWGAALLGAVADDVVIVTRDEQETRGRWRYVRDELADHGPMAGVLTGLRHIRHDRAVVLPIDMPLLTVGFLIFLRDAGLQADITVPRWTRVEPLVGVYARGCIDGLAAALAGGEDSLGRFFRETTLSVRYIAETDIRRFGHPERIFFNINHPEDLEEAEALLRGGTGAEAR